MVQVGWRIKHQTRGWGTVTSLANDGSGRVTARFADGEERWVTPASIVNSSPGNRTRVPAKPDIQAAPTKRELQDRKDKIKSLLEAGDEDSADGRYQQAGFGNFWPADVYEKTKQDIRRQFRNRIGKSAVDGDMEGAERIFREKCSRWMTVTEFNDSVLKGLEAGGRWLSAMEWVISTKGAAHTSFKELLVRVLQNCETQALRELGPPDADWMAVLPVDARARLLEWHLLSRAVAEPRGNWLPWFPGADVSEIDLATRFIDEAGRDDFIRAWLERIIGNGLLSEEQSIAWAKRSPRFAFALFDMLPGALQCPLMSQWRKDPSELDRQLGGNVSRARQLLSSSALTFDLETDGERIWEIGCVQREKAERLHDERLGTSLDEALSSLEGRIQSAPLIVGHNILSWDWPIVSRHIKPESTPLIWDTLLVQYLLEPQAKSHALGGSHHADDDAKVTADLFRQQLDGLPPSIARGVLVGTFTDATHLLSAIASAVAGSQSYMRDAPNWLGTVPNVSDRQVLTSESRLRDLDWVPGVAIVAPDAVTGLKAGWRQVDLARLESGLQDAGPLGKRVAARVVLEVARMAAARNIALRRNMIPAWLLDEDGQLASVIDMACIAPAGIGSIRCAAMPNRSAWWRETDPGSYVIAGLNENTLVLDRQEFAAGDLVPVGSGLPSAPFMRFGNSTEGPLWVMVDKAAQLLNPRGGLHGFRVLQVDTGLQHVSGEQGRVACRPVFAVRRQYVLYPRADDQANYWIDVLRTFAEFATSSNEMVPILLVGSSRSAELIELLETALAELGLGEIKPPHRSRREHLLRALRHGNAVVSPIDHWPTWKTISQAAGVTLRPIVEALPLEEWYAGAEACKTPLAGLGTSSAPVGSTEPLAIETASLLEKLPSIVEARMQGWLRDISLADYGAPIIIDPRVGAMARGAKRFADVFPLAELPLSERRLRGLEIVLSRFKVSREEAPSGIEAMEKFLVANWQPRNAKGGNAVAGFKPSQRIAMEAICDRTANVLVSLPTGEGKSVLFQVPALGRGLRNRRLTLVLSPLKALMHDQVERLREQGFSESADYISGDRSSYEIEEVIQGVLDHRIVLLYVSPERLRSTPFLDVLEKRMRSDGGLEHVVVDETHCVNQWGYEFRPDYFNAVELLLRMCREMDGAEPTQFLLLSATITASDRARLESILSGNYGAMGSLLPLLAKPDAFTNPLRSHIAVQPRRVRGKLSDRKEFEKALAERVPFIEKAISEAQQNRKATGQRSAVLIFVSSRSHAEAVAITLSSTLGDRIDYYHAGLDSVSRDEIYKRFLDGELDVLVATKAFGMGMDIPDIHWVVHLSPPGYLEDYLQEVGRIGRGDKQRARAALDSLSAVLLFSDSDFESIRTMRARSALSLPAIKDLYSGIVGQAYELDGQRMAIVPSEGFDPPQTLNESKPAARRGKATKVRMALYWLERAGAIRLCGSIPDLIVITIHPRSLERLSAEGGAVGEMARLILELVQVDERMSGATRAHAAALFDMDFDQERNAVGGQDLGFSPDDSPHERGIFNAVVGAVGRLVGAFAESVGIQVGLAKKQSVQSLAESVVVMRRGAAPLSASSSKRVILNLSKIRLRAPTLKSVGDVFSCLAELERLGGVKIDREVQILPRKLAREPKQRVDVLFDYVDQAAKELIRQLAEKGGRVEFNPYEMAEVAEDLQVRPNVWALYERAFVSGFLSLVRASGVRTRQLARDDQRSIWEAVLAPSARHKADQARESIRKGAQSVFRTVGNERAVKITTLIEKLRSNKPGGRFSERDLKRAANLLSAMNLINISTDLVPLSHVVILSDQEGSGDLDAKAELWDELRRINEMAEARNLAMEVFANLESQAHPAFIEGYFASADAESLRMFLDTQLGEILPEEGGGGTSVVIGEMREKLRATKATEFFERFETSEEPMQWEVVRHAFDGHVLVNAGPGAGKTFVLVGRIAHLIRHQNIDPSQIIVLAFNRAVVFEIKRRIRELFKSLGYAAYAARLRVSTFHSFAMVSLKKFGNVDPAEMNLDEVLKEFAERMSKDASFRQVVAGNARSILVDEFQDMTDTVYSVISSLYLGSGSRAGVMVIGDDDQDILRWQRLKGGGQHQFSESYFSLFEQDFGGSGLSKFFLKKNFRSDRRIVELSQKMIVGCLDGNPRSGRLKNLPLEPREGVKEGGCDRIPWEDKRWDDALDESAKILTKLQQDDAGSIAILCRTNAEVAETHGRLASVLPGLTIQGGANLRVAKLRHVGLWLDHLRKVSATGDAVLSDGLRDEVQQRFAQLHPLPEVLRPESADVRLDQLWQLCAQERTYPHMSDLVRFVEPLRVDEYGRMTSTSDPASGAVVATIHKVKGLEFDNVLILPSAADFPLRDGNDVAGAAAEEARLLYVGMTRAKHQLHYFVGGREQAWARRMPFHRGDGRLNGYVLEGLMGEVRLSWSIKQSHFNRDPWSLQQYIERNVGIGDAIFLGGAGSGAGRGLVHRGKSGDSAQIGYLSNEVGAGGRQSALKVSAVIRYQADLQDQDMPQEIRDRGWGYVVLVSGRLR